MKRTSTTTALSSSTKPSVSVSVSVAMEDGSCYYPGCRKDANCSCKFCIDSIKSTLDLMPFSVQKSSLTKLSTASNAVDITPLSFGSLSTPTSRSTRFVPPLRQKEIPTDAAATPKTARSSTGKSPKEDHPRRAEKDRGFTRGFFLVLAIVLGFLEMGFYYGVVYGFVKPVFSSDSVRSVGEGSSGVKGLDGKVRFLERSLEGLNGVVSNCSLANSKWVIDQDGLLLNSHCKLYKSLVEEIRIWGWPLQTAGLLVSGFSSRQFTVISGRVTEWPDGKIGYVTRGANLSWTHLKWGSSAVQFDPNTWILEYRRSTVLENPRLVSATMGYLGLKVGRIVRKVKMNFWRFSSLDKTRYCSLQVPT